MIETAKGLELATIAEDGRDVFGGHAFRVTGAKHLARLGLEPRIIALLARHQSDVIMTYVQQAPLEVLTEAYRATRAAVNYASSSSSSAPQSGAASALGSRSSPPQRLD